MSKWNRPMRTYKPEHGERPLKVPSVHPKVRGRVLAAIPPGAACSLNDLEAYTGYEVAHTTEGSDRAREVTQPHRTEATAGRSD